MAMLGLRLLDFEAPPTYPQLKQLIVFIEMDRCTGDAVAFVTNAKLGRRSRNSWITASWLPPS
jgi:formylmethanofuran dehydrogenase subunit E